MKAVLPNLKPFIAYWACFGLYFVVPFLSSLLPVGWFIAVLVLLCVLNAITGYTDGVQKAKWGIAVFGLQLVFCAALALVPGFESRLPVFGNFIMSTVFFHSESMALNVLFAVLSVVLVLAPFFIGAALQKRVRIPVPQAFKTPKVWLRLLGVCIGVNVVLVLGVALYAYITYDWLTTSIDLPMTILLSCAPYAAALLLMITAHAVLRAQLKKKGIVK